MFTKTRAHRPRATRLLEALLGPHGVDRYTELVDPLWTSASRATVVGIERSTPRSVTLRLNPNRPINARAGQHVTVSVEIDGRRHSRCYSPAGPEGAPSIELTITRHEGGKVSEYLYENARPGMVVDLSDPAGDFVLPDRRPDRLVLIAGGSGITPVMSMIRTLQECSYAGEVAVLYYARTLADASYVEQLNLLPDVRVLYGCTRGPGGDLEGHFTAQHLAAAMSDPDAVYVCGPAALIAAVRGVYPAAQAESFTPTPLATGESPVGGRIRFSASAVDAENDGRPLLAQAEAAGLTPLSGCRMGICHTCTRRKVHGVVRNLTTGAVSTDDDESVQICVSVPVGDVDIDL